jgi:DNA-binding LytR/AlgR family response regulator
MNCIIIDDEPLARKGIQLLVDESPYLTCLGSFNQAHEASQFLQTTSADLIFLDIKMPGINGIEFARTIPHHTLVIFVTAFTEFAVDSYEVEAVDFLVKPVDEKRFHKAVEKASAYHVLLTGSEKNTTERITGEYIFVKADRRFVKINFADITYIEALKDYVIIHETGHRVITRMNLKAIQEQLPSALFMRISKSYIINTKHITSFDNNSIMIGTNEIFIGDNYRNRFFDDFVAKNMLYPNK